MFFKNTMKKVHAVVDKGSKDIQSLVQKAETFVGQSEDILKESGNSVKIMTGFVVVAMGLQILVSYTQLRVNIKMLGVLRGFKKK